MNFLTWLLTVILAFSLGANSSDSSRPKQTDEELRSRVQEHIDVIVDESAAIVDELRDSVREDERVKQADQFVRDVKEIAQETAEDLHQVVEKTKTRLEEKFGAADQIEGTEEATEPVSEAAGDQNTESPAQVAPAGQNPEAPAAPGSVETPGPGDGING